MTYQYLPNSNPDLVVIEAERVETSGGDALEFTEYPIIGWQLDEDERDDLMLEPTPIAIGWSGGSTHKLAGNWWGVLDRRQGLVLNDFGMWSADLAEWKAAREREFQAEQDAEGEHS